MLKTESPFFMLYRQINDCAAPFISASTCGSSLSGLAELWKDGIMEGIYSKSIARFNGSAVGLVFIDSDLASRTQYCVFVNMDPKILQCSYSSQ